MALNNGILGTGLLKKVNERKSFCSYDIIPLLENKSISLNERMRVIDAFHIHAPIEEECTLLHIPDDRINLLNLKELLYLCGGGVGVRFTSEDFFLMKSLLNEMKVCWDSIDHKYKSLSPAMRKKIVINCSCETESNIEKELLEAISLHETMDKYLLLVKNLQRYVQEKQSTIVPFQGGGKFDRFMT